MSKLHIAFIIVISSLMLIVASGRTTRDRDLTRFRVYVHEFVGGPNATLHEVARADITANSPSSFGLVRVGDDLMTSGLSSTTGQLGRSQGLVVNSGLSELMVTLNVNFMFTAGKYKGGSITVVGYKNASSVNQELPVVGGTGIFRLVRGYAVSNTYSFDPLTNYLVFFYDFYVYLN